MALIYMVEDDETIRQLLNYALQARGYDIKSFEDGESFLKVYEDERCDLLLLDLMLPGMQGTEVLEYIRKKKGDKKLPVLVLTAKNSEPEIAKTLDMGADDYLTKPFGIMELLSRVNALLRRSQGEDVETVLEVGKIKMDLLKRETFLDGEEINLSLREFELLAYFLKNPTLALSREQILEKVWGFDYAGETRTVDMHITFLRQKLGKYKTYIETLRGIGYKFNPKAEPLKED